MIRILLLTVALQSPARDPWFGADKLKHFLMSAFAQSVGFSVGRAAGLDRRTAHLTGGISAAGVGVWKEMVDRRSGRPFSTRDLLWDAAGAGSAGLLLHRTR
jgi:uncharacterized protein YfiM (DUF2279 family)